MNPSRLWLANGILTLVVAAAAWGWQTGQKIPTSGDFLARLSLDYNGWKTQDTQLNQDEIDTLQPDSVLVRRYQSPSGQLVDLAVIAGHQKRTVHTPGFCMAGGGWEVLSQDPVTVNIDGKPVPAMRSVMSREQLRALVTYFFSDGEVSTHSLPRYQWEQLVKRLRGQVCLGALVRVIVPFDTDIGAATALTSDFSNKVLPTVLRGIRDARKQP